MHVAQRIRRELTPLELNSIDIDSLPEWLEARAESIHEEYARLLSNPLAVPEKVPSETGRACRRWREAEDLAYLVAVADDVGLNARAV